jgi:outer membrane lipoprotein-sorting protein
MVLHRLNRLALIIGTLFIVTAPAYANLPENQNLPPEVQKAQDYLNGLEKLKSRFVMNAAENVRLTGTFYLSRPGRLRFDFDDPVKDFIVADGRFIYFYDDDLGEQSNAPIGSTMADFLLRPDIRLYGDVNVTKIMRAAGLVQITVQQKKDPGAGQLILGVDAESFELKKWRVIDSLGNITEIDLVEVEKDPILDASLFYYIKPKHEGDHYNE